MKIAIDVRRIEDFGVGTYIRNLIKTLATTDSQNSYLLLGDADKVSAVAAWPENFRIIKWGLSQDTWKTHIQLNHLLEAHAVNVLHIPFLRVAWLVPCRYLMTVHDVADFLYDGHGGWRRNLRWRGVHRTLARACQILAGSKATQRGI